MSETPDQSTPGGGTLDATALTASFTVKDVEQSLSWYRDMLGFAVQQRHEREGVLRAVSMEAGNVRLLLGLDNGAKGWDRVKGQGFSLQIVVRGPIDPIADRIKLVGYDLETEPMDMPWGARVFRVRDPDGFLLAIASDTTE